MAPLPRLAAALLFALFTLHASHAFAGTPEAASVTPVTPDAALTAGAPAPDFDFIAADCVRVHLRDLLAQGDVLLVFAASDDPLRALEAQRTALRAAGVIPLALTQQGDADASRTAARCGLAYGLLSDPAGSVAERYGVVDPATGSFVPAWFVIDRNGGIRAAERGTRALDGLARAAAEAVGHPSASAESF